MNQSGQGAVRSLGVKAGSGTCNIFVGHDLLVETFIDQSKNVVVVTDSVIAELHRVRLKGFDLIIVPPGEESKSLATLEYLYSEFLRRNLDRSSLVIGFGGGVVTDLVGFAAATYLRGLAYGCFATTLLAQVDASIGGKNGINFSGYKNLVGTIRQPNFCVCDTAVLRTLPKRELHSGFAEVIKHACIKSRELFDYLELEQACATALDSMTINKIVFDSVSIKAAVVENDEREVGERMKLNFGHTLGHAIELAHGIAHGEAVAIGMVAAAHFSVRRGILSDQEFTKIKELINRYNLPTSIEIDSDSLVEGMLHDKKRYKDAIKMVFLAGIGNAEVVDVPVSSLKEMLDDLRNSW